MRRAFAARSKHVVPEIGAPNLKLAGARGKPCSTDLDTDDERFIHATKTARTQRSLSARPAGTGHSVASELNETSYMPFPIDAIAHQVANTGRLSPAAQRYNDSGALECSLVLCPNPLPADAIEHQDSNAMQASELNMEIAVQHQEVAAGPRDLGGSKIPKSKRVSPSESSRATKVARGVVESGRDEDQASQFSAGVGPSLPPPPPPPLPVFPRVSRSGGFSYACPRHGKNHRWTMLDPCLDCISAAEQAML